MSEQSHHLLRTKDSLKKCSSANQKQTKQSLKQTNYASVLRVCVSVSHILVNFVLVW